MNDLNLTIIAGRLEAYDEQKLEQLASPRPVRIEALTMSADADRKRENMSNEPTWQTVTTVWSKDGDVKYKMVATERKSGIDEKTVVEVCAFWTREANADSMAHSASHVMGSYFNRNGAIDFIANHIASLGAHQLMADGELNKATFCALCETELEYETQKNILMRSPVTVNDGFDNEPIITKGQLAVLCNACYGSMKSIQANA